MLEVRQSNCLEVLADRLVERLGQVRTTDLLTVDLVVVQSLGMATWLRHHLAERCQIAAAVAFPLPAAFLWRVVCALSPKVPDESPFARRFLRWHLFRLLAPGSALLAEPHCKRLAWYLEDDETGLKRWQLAERIADVFDQYLVYRPDWLQRWGAGEEAPAGTSEEIWQPLVWRTLVATLGEQFGDGAGQDRATLMAAARACLEAGQGQEDCRNLLRAAGLPERIDIFGISAMPPEQLRLLLALSAHIDVTLYAFNPCRQYWNDLVSESYLAQCEAEERVREEATPRHPYYEVGHPLLAELGASGRDFVDLILELGENADLVDDFVTPEGSQALMTLQRDMLDLEPGAEPLTLAPDDDSLAFLECHGPLRELEVLHDRLLARFAADPDLEPREVVVMIPHIDHYAPYVEAVFGGITGDAAIPYSISDHGLGVQTSVLGAVATLLRLPRSRLTVSEVFGLLETPALLRACRLTAEDLPALRHHIDEAAIRWGLDGAHWERLNFPAAQETQANTWGAGADRLLLGFAMGEAAAPFADRQPLAVEGEDADAIGRLLDFVDRLAHHAGRLRGPHRAGTWAERIRALLRDCLDEGPEDTDALNGVRGLLSELEARAAAVADEVLSLEVLLALLAPALAAREGGHRFLSGGVTFCTLMPMRTIPFRVVALLGMNGADYPRPAPPRDFDMTGKYWRKGDRARRREDQFLFLEALLAAREQLFVSWSGGNACDDTRQPPSVLVEALLEAVDRRFQTPDGRPGREQFYRSYPLQPFSARYDAETLHTASRLWALAQARPAEREPNPCAPGAVQLPAPELEPGAALTLSALVRFLADPPGGILREQFGVYFDQATAEVDDDEPFLLTGLERYRLEDSVLELLRNDGDIQAWRAREAATGRLPQGQAGEEALLKAQELHANYAERLGPLLGEHQGKVSLDLDLDGQALSGEVPGCCAGVRVRLMLHPRRAGARVQVRAWVEHLALAVGGEGRATLLIDDTHAYHFAALDSRTARDLLLDLMALRTELLMAPGPLLCASSAVFAQELARNRNEAGALAEARKKEWAVDASDYYRREGERPTVRRLWPRFPGDDERLRPGFVALSLRVWQPLLDGCERLSKVATQQRANELGGVSDD